MKNKKGELTTQQLVTIIILITSFVIILFLFFRLGLGEETNKEICHNSVVMKSKSALKSGGFDCKTTYVCISGGGDCEEFVPTVTVKANTNEEIVEAIQKEIKDCDWMFGDGEINYVSSKIPLVGIEIPTLHYYCAICSSIKFDEKVQNNFPIINFNGQQIFTNEKYSIFTGMDADFGTDDNLPAKIIKSSEIGSTYCDTFIHKA